MKTRNIDADLSSLEDRHKNHCNTAKSTQIFMKQYAQAQNLSSGWAGLNVYYMTWSMSQYSYYTYIFKLKFLGYQLIIPNCLLQVTEMMSPFSCSSYISAEWDPSGERWFFFVTTKFCFYKTRIQSLNMFDYFLIFEIFNYLLISEYFWIFSFFKCSNVQNNQIICNDNFNKT